LLTAKENLPLTWPLKVCVCVRERERERQTDRQTDRERKQRVLQNVHLHVRKWTIITANRIVGRETRALAGRTLLQRYGEFSGNVALEDFVSCKPIFVLNQRAF